MKKLMTLAALVAACAPAFTAEVESSNVVGYQKIAITQGYNLVGLQFNEIGGIDKGLSSFGTLDNSFNGYDGDYNFSTTLRTWDKAGQEYAYFGWAGSSGTDVDDDPTLDNTWTDLNAYAVDDTIENGSGVWVIAEHAGEMLFTGEVTMTNLTVNLVQGYNLVANPYPKAVSVTNFGVLDNSFDGYDGDYNFSCNMRSWDVANQEYVYFGWAGTSGTTVDDDPTLDNTWTDLNAYAVNDTIPAGGAVWIIVPHAGTITFSISAQ